MRHQDHPVPPVPGNRKWVKEITEEIEMMLHVQYKNYRYDFVNTQTLNRLLAGKEILRYLRPSEKKWINADTDPVRGSGGEYSGPERRQSSHDLRLLMCA
jgi:hypothetical protein